MLFLHRQHDLLFLLFCTHHFIFLPTDCFSLFLSVGIGALWRNITNRIFICVCVCLCVYVIYIKGFIIKN